MRKDGLRDAYELVMESEKKGTVDAFKTNRINQTFEGGEKGSPKAGGSMKMGSQEASKKVPQKVSEAPKDLNPGHGKIATEGKEIKDMLPKSAFDELFKSTLVEEESLDAEESPLERSGDEEFSDERGDFPPAEDDEDIGEEVDIATELRMIIDRLTEVAEKLGAFEDEGAEGEEAMGEPPVEEPAISPESVQRSGKPVTEAPVATKGLKPLPDTVAKMTSKKFKVDSAFDVTSHKEGDAGNPRKDAADGKLKPLKKTTFGPKMSQKADVKGVLGKPGAGLFDAV